MIAWVSKAIKDLLIPQQCTSTIYFYMTLFVPKSCPVVITWKFSAILVFHTGYPLYINDSTGPALTKIVPSFFSDHFRSPRYSTWWQSAWNFPRSYKSSLHRISLGWFAIAAYLPNNSYCNPLVSHIISFTCIESKLLKFSKTLCSCCVQVKC